MQEKEIHMSIKVVIPKAFCLDVAQCRLGDLFVCLFGFHGISTFVGYSNPFLYE